MDIDEKKRIQRKKKERKKSVRIEAISSNATDERLDQDWRRKANKKWKYISIRTDRPNCSKMAENEVRRDWMKRERGRK